jgi:F-type H+-transporting ATPase subunit d
MSGNRIAKSAIDWAKFARLVPEADKGKFIAFKARSDGYLRQVMESPENPPQIDWSFYRKNVVNKAVVDKLESAMKSAKIPYPQDKVTPAIDDQQRESENDYKEFVKISEAKIAEAEVQLNKFKVMIPYDQMLNEDFQLTFPDWSIRREDPSVEPHAEKMPGVSKAEREEFKKVGPKPECIP